MSLSTDIRTAKGYIPNTPQKVHETGSGFAPYLWFGDDAVDGDALPWVQAPIGSIYEYKPSESATPYLYQKIAANGVDADWGKLVPSLDAGVQIKKIPVAVLTAGEKDTGWDLPAKAVVLNVWVDVTTAEETASTKTIDVGLLSSETGGDADGFLNDVSTSTTGVKKGTLASAGQTLGALLRVDESGGGVLVPEGHVAGSVIAKSVSYTLGDAATELVADIYIQYALLG